MSHGERVLFRRSRHLVCYWKQGDVVLHNYATGIVAVVEGLSLTVALLDFFDSWRPVSELFAGMSQYSRASLRRALSSLMSHTFLQRSDRPPHPDEQLMETWATWNPAAGFFHTTTKNTPYGKTSRASRRSWRLNRGPTPDPVKHYPGTPSVSLPPAQTHGEFPQVLLARRTWRRFDNRPLTLSHLGTLLGLTWAIQHKVRGPDGIGVVLKTSPSGGACHPLEVYVLVIRVTGIRRGLYHYRADDHRLELIRAGASAGQVTRYLPTSWWYARAGMLTLITAVFPRKQWRYRYPRVYRSILIEAGHFCQTFCLVATWLGLAPFCTAALSEADIEKDLGLDGVTESVLYAAGVGTRPPGTSWAPVPGRRRDPVLRKWTGEPAS